jgi:hypothetical protein
MEKGEPRNSPFETLESREPTGKHGDWLKPMGAPVKECPNFSFWVNVFFLRPDGGRLRPVAPALVDVRAGVDWEWDIVLPPPAMMKEGHEVGEKIRKRREGTSSAGGCARADVNVAAEGERVGAGLGRKRENGARKKEARKQGSREGRKRLAVDSVQPILLLLEDSAERLDRMDQPGPRSVWRGWLARAKRNFTHRERGGEGEKGRECAALISRTYQKHLGNRLIFQGFPSSTLPPR